MNSDKKSNDSKYPLIIKPEEHGLFNYYKRLEKWGFILLPIVFLCNEFFLRPILISKDISSSSLLWLAYIVNIDFPVELGSAALNGVIMFSFTVCLFAYLQPKWGHQTLARGMKSGVPVQIAEYRNAVFLVRNRIQLVAFHIYHKVLMKLAFVGCFLVVTGVANLLRRI
jgi:hypothetical protein